MQETLTTKLTARQKKLIEENIELPEKVARKLVRTGDIEEATDVARMALVEAARRFEDQCEVGAFMYQRIRWALLKWLKARQGVVSLDVAAGEDGTLIDFVQDGKAVRPDQQAEHNEAKAELVGKLKKQGSITLSECHERTPAPEGLGEYYRKMRKAICDSVGEEEIYAIMERMVSKAKKGNIAAAKLVLSQVAGSAPKVTQTIQVNKVALHDFEEGAHHD